MQWEVRGTRGGKPGQWRIQASSAESAKAKATGAGVAVHQVKAFSPPLSKSAAEPPPKSSAHSAAPTEPEISHQPAAEEEHVEQAVVVAEEEPEEDDSESEWTHVAAPPEAVAPQTSVSTSVAPSPVAYYAPPAQAAAGPAPAYGSIVVGANVLKIFSILVFVAAAIAFVVPLWALYASSTMRGFGPATLIVAGPGILAALGLVAVGILIRLVAAVSLAIRDIARNSFR